MRKTYMICATAALGLCLMAPKGASALPAADGAGKALSAVAGKSAATEVRYIGRVGAVGFRGGIGYRRFGVGYRRFGYGLGYRRFGLGYGLGWRRAALRRGYYGGLGYGWGWPVGLGVGLGAAATGWGWGSGWGWPGWGWGAGWGGGCGGYYPATYSGCGCGF